MSALTSTETHLAGQLGVADDLLSRANLFLRIEVSAAIECHSTLRGEGNAVVPVPGTLCADVVDDIERHVQLIRDIEAHLAGEPWEGPVGWFDDVIQRRNGWEGGVR
ncbi:MULTISPECIES: hypothetical protein [unclassified Sphingopyxis]|uniref:hypothetical protein n=1 Tax=unclassified Sphingopyxis TaxID=2614943 RepID=UPI000730786C|nr:MULTISPECIES: hypothetical protein [unclassified Sphingopyxis]KTE24435.1 hypothetical protein ATE61_13595 [Sphingopyxis sp. H057]KTE50963.1 hypothetical protein ATE69_17295 [Sphingopyxis sp. H071]KTE52106.1 hypothetical protein ATE64_11900 [Sphingopyxis sp. H073]KTE60561.1 hypothetical protein ATE66_08245 [Sphingopyxis sp. H107]KTE63850.1 hypothetical protein ATE65_13690 [Sphingopyxis sp. H100]